MAMICRNTPLYSCGEHEQQYIVCVSSVPVHVLSQVCVCVCVPEGNVLQHSWVGVPLTWAVPFLFPWSGKGCCLPRVCLSVSENAHFTHVTTAEAAALLSCFAGLRRAATHCMPGGGDCGIAVHWSMVPGVSHNNARSEALHQTVHAPNPDF